MATIKIHDLNPTGSQLFSDSESYLNELTDDEININGGGNFGYSYANLGISRGQGQSISFTGYGISRGQGVSYRFW